MNGVSIESKIKLNLTAKQWQLYSDMEGVEDAAQAMNTLIAEELNAGRVNGACEVLQKFRRFGAADSEPYWVLENIVRKMGLAEEN